MLNKDKLLEILKEMDSSIDYKVTLILLGGSALSLLELKQGTEDIDYIFLTDKKEEFELLCEKFIPKIKHEIHYMQDFTVSHMNLPDYLNRSKPYTNVNFRNLSIKTLNIYDILLSKISRFSKGDLIDIESILGRESIKEDELDRRYEECFDAYIVSLEKGQFRKRYEEFKKLYRDRLK